MTTMPSLMAVLDVLVAVTTFPVQEVSAGGVSRTAAKVVARNAAERKVSFKTVAKQPSNKLQLVDRITH